jgi:hypothetical protein
MTIEIKSLFVFMVSGLKVSEAKINSATSVGKQK